MMLRFFGRSKIPCTITKLTTLCLAAQQQQNAHSSTVPKQEPTTQPAQTQESAVTTPTHAPPPIAQQLASKLEPQLSEEQLTIPGNQSTVTSTASGIRRAKKKIVLEVLNVAYAEGTNQPVSFTAI